MRLALTLIFSFAYFSTLVFSHPGASMIGPGKWIVMHIKKCPDDGKYAFQFDINRKKMNRTHDGFFGWLNLDRDLDETYAVRVDVCKHVDGGCKPYQIITDDSFCHFIDKYAKDNVEKMFLLSGLDLPICPIPAGKHEMANYMFDYTELPEKGVYGLFGVTALVLDGEEAVACVDLTVEFDSDHDND